MIKKKTLYTNFLGYLTKKGNKISAQNILDNAFLKVSKVANLSTFSILTIIFIKLNVFVEVKKVRIKRSTHIVPFATSFKRKSYLIIKWIMESVSEDKRRVAMSEKLATEFLSILKNKLSKSLKKKNSNIIQALNNRSNIHFRW